MRIGFAGDNPTSSLPLEQATRSLQGASPARCLVPSRRTNNSIALGTKSTLDRSDFDNAGDQAVYRARLAVLAWLKNVLRSGASQRGGAHNWQKRSSSVAHPSSRKGQAPSPYSAIEVSQHLRQVEVLLAVLPPIANPKPTWSHQHDRAMVDPGTWSSQA